MALLIGWDPIGRLRAQSDHAILKCLLAALLIASSGPARAATITANSPSLDDVKTAIGHAAEGDTVVLPAGVFAWRSTLHITKAITLQGQTTTDSVAGTASDNTIIQDNVPRPPSAPLIRLSSVLGKSYRITGITFAPRVTGSMNYNGAVIVNGDSQAVRIDHCHFRQMDWQSTYVQIAGLVYGVADHNVLQLGNNSESFVFWADGDLSWARPTNFGSSQFFFVEDNYIANVSNFNELGGNSDDSNGGVWVFRHNHCYDIEIQTHGTETGRNRGGRAREIYNNDFHYAHAHAMGGIRGGVTITHDNTFDGVQPTKGLVLTSYRAFQPNDPATFGSGTGDNPWDVNATEPDGTHVEGRPPYLFESGTASNGSSGATLVDSTKNWTPNQWSGFTVKRVSDGNLSSIFSNTSNTLSLYYGRSGYGGGNPVWTAGTRYQIHKALVLLDQPGRGQGDLVTGDPPTNSRTGRPSWPNQLLEPSYCWNDIFTPTRARVTFFIDGTNTHLQQLGRDYFNNTPMPGYTPYTYPHPLTTSLPPSRGSKPNKASSTKHDQKKTKKRGWGVVTKKEKTYREEPHK
jgi:hypothetical protein